MGRQNPRWGYMRIRGELLKLGVRISATTIATVLRRAVLGPAPRRGPTWSQFLRHQAAGILACDFLTVETIRLKTLYVLVWIELGTRKVHLGGATSYPDSAWVTQQGRNLAMALQEEGRSPRFLIHDRDTKFTGPFDEVFRSAGMRIVLTPIRAPNAVPFAHGLLYSAGEDRRRPPRVAVLVGHVDGDPERLQFVLEVQGQVHGAGKPLGLVGDHGIESPVLAGRLRQESLDACSVG
jgi:hypothetical protein